MLPRMITHYRSRFLISVLVLLALAGCSAGATGAPAVSLPTASPGVSMTPSVAPTTAVAPSVTPATTPAVPMAGSCPAQPVALAALIALDAPPGGPLSRAFPPLFGTYGERGLACFGGQTLTVTGFVASPGGLGGTMSYTRAPDWLYAGWYLQPTDRMTELGPGVRVGGGPFLPIAVPPALGSCGAEWQTEPACPFGRYVGHWIKVSGHFDDPAAGTCHVSSRNPSANPASVPTASQVVEICRSVFVLSAIEPVSS